MKNNTKTDDLIKYLKSLNFECSIKNASKKTIVCDFKEYNDFYFEKLRKNNIEILNNNEIVVPARFNFDLFNKKNLLIFDIDGVIFDVSKSYLSAIIETFKYFSGFSVSIEEVLEVKSLTGMNCDWDATQYLLKKYNIHKDINEIGKVFQDFFYNPNIENKNFLINKEQLLISKEVFEKLSQKYDLVVFSGRLKYEVNYSFKKHDIDKYFYYYITSDNLEKNKLKPNPWGVFEILKHCPHKEVFYIGDSIDDIKAGNEAGVKTIAIVYPCENYQKKVEIFKNLKAGYIIDNVEKIL